MRNIDDKDLGKIAGGGVDVKANDPNSPSNSTITPPREGGDPNTPDVFSTDAENSGPTDLNQG